MFTKHAVCPITGFDVVLYEKLDDSFKGIRFIIPSISERLLISIEDGVLQDSELREAFIKHRNRFVANLKIIALLRQGTIISLSNWWLFLE